jgi:hypothetical protein
MAIACLSKSEIVAIGLDAFFGLQFQGAQTIIGGGAIAKKATTDARNIENVIHVGLPIVRRPIDGF